MVNFLLLRSLSVSCILLPHLSFVFFLIFVCLFVCLLVFVPFGRSIGWSIGWSIGRSHAHAHTRTCCLQYGDCKFSDLEFTVENNGVKVSYPTDPSSSPSCTLNTMKVPGSPDLVTYEAIQFHVHAQSEHTIDGTQFGAELHVVHRAVGTNIKDVELDFDLGLIRYTLSLGLGSGTPNFSLSVLGLMIQPVAGAPDNEFFGKLLEKWEEAEDAVKAGCNMTTAGSTNTALGAQPMDVYELAPNDGVYYQYEGGLTTPPCSGE